MASNPSLDLPAFLDSSWINLSPDERLRAIEKMQASGPESSRTETQAALLHIARHDEHADVRSAAVRYLTALPPLLALQQTDPAIADAIQQQVQRLLAGAVDSDLSDAERIAAIASQPQSAVKHIALQAKSKAAGNAALERITEAVELADLSQYAASVHVRKNAVMKINDATLLKELAEKVQDNDKTVAKLLQQRIAEISTETPGEKTGTTVKTGKTEKAAKKSAPESISEPTPEPIPETTPESAAKSSTDKPDSTPKPKTKKAPKSGSAKNQPAASPEVELPQLEQQLAKLSFKHTEQLNVLRNSLNRVRKSVAAEATELTALAQAMHSQLTEKLEKNHVHQEHLLQVTTTLLEQLQQALDSGQSQDALPTWDKIQGNINNTSGKIRAALQQLANVHKAKLNELRDWKSFAATEKKKELIAQMQHLLESKMHAADRSRHISKMHQEWKSLGRSDQNEQLWREFKKISDKAYEPCKDYFKQRKQLMATNFLKRREICEQLEAEVAKLETNPEPNISELNTLLNDADKLWKEHAPIEQSKIKSLQKRYYAAINQLRKSRKHSLRGNAEKKQQFITEANTLAEHEDNQHAMREAKRLQQEWKQIGPTSFKEDKKYWEDFRAACDKIFAKRTQAATTQREAHKQADGKLSEILQGMEAIFALEDEAFRNARSDYQTLAQEFTANIDPRQGNQAKRVQEQFNGLKRKIDSRFKSLPDKKQLQLKNAVLEKARFLQDIEAKLLACTDEARFAAIKDSIDAIAWQEMGSSGDSKYDQALTARLQRIQQAPSLKSLRAIADECEEQARALCIELEIRANIDTPKEDQGQRMQIQLDQLKHGFGKQKPDPKENSSYAMDMELQSYCLGPLEAKFQQEMAQRLQGAIKKLL